MQTLGYILIAKPEFMLQKEIMNLIEATLSSGVDHRLKVLIFFSLASTLL
jgi:cohesin loading factor subunit SCC2